MMTKQTYHSQASARRAAVADLGKGAEEGRDYTISRLDEGRYMYRRVCPWQHVGKAADKKPPGARGDMTPGGG